MTNGVIRLPSRATMGRILASVALAAILWAWVTTLRDPETSRLFPNIPVAAENLPSGLVLTTESEEARIRVSGPESVIDQIQQDDIQAVADLSDVTEPGRYAVPVQVDAPSDVWRTSVDPDSVEVVVDQSITREFPLIVEVSGVAETNLRTATVEPAVSTVEVTGPSSLVEIIDRIVLPTEVAGRTGAYDDVTVPMALDAQDDIVLGVSIDPAVVDVMVVVSSRGKSVAVLPATTGIPAAGFDIVNRTAIPPTVVIDGPTELLAQVVALSTEPVNVNGATANLTATVQLADLPDGVEILQPENGMVDVLVQVEQRGVRQVLPGQQVIVVNVEDGFSAAVSPNEIAIEVVAPEEVLVSMTGSQFQVVVDAQGLAEGLYSVEPTVNVPANVQWVAAEPSEVELTVTRDEAE